MLCPVDELHWKTVTSTSGGGEGVCERHLKGLGLHHSDPHWCGHCKMFFAVKFVGYHEPKRRSKENFRTPGGLREVMEENEALEIILSGHRKTLNNAGKQEE